MKKSKLLALILVIAIMLMGAGYAAWQETLTINSTVSTGELNMEFKSNVVYPILTTFDNIKWPLFKDFFGDSTIVQDIPNDTVTVTINDMYPGSTFNYDLRADNKGTIPATVESIEIDLTGVNPVFAQTIKVSGAILHRKDNNILKHSKNKVTIIDIPLNQLETYLNNNMNGWKIEVGEHIVFDLPIDEDDENKIREQLSTIIPGYDAETTNCLFFHMPLTAGNEIQDLDAQNFSIKFNFKQFNQ